MAYQQSQQPQYQYEPHAQQQGMYQQTQQQPPVGYASQPAMQVHQAPPQTEEWKASLMNCSPCESCLLASCLPCLILGKTSERMRDPTLQSYEAINTDCLLMFGITYLGCGCIYIMIKRGEIRERFGIKGSSFGDCCVSCWCGCCALIQQDNEVKKRLEGLNVQGYQPQQGMHMPQQDMHMPQQGMHMPPPGGPVKN